MKAAVLVTIVGALVCALNWWRNDRKAAREVTGIVDALTAYRRELEHQYEWRNDDGRNDDGRNDDGRNDDGRDDDGWGRGRHDDLEHGRNGALRLRVFGPVCGVGRHGAAG